MNHDGYIITGEKTGCGVLYTDLICTSLMSLSPFDLQLVQIWSKNLQRKWKDHCRGNRDFLHAGNHLFSSCCFFSTHLFHIHSVCTVCCSLKKTRTVLSQADYFMYLQIFKLVINTHHLFPYMSFLRLPLLPVLTCAYRCSHWC